MPLEDTGTDPASRRDVQENLRDATKELQSLTVKVAAGAAAATNIAIAGLDTNDVIVSVLHFNIATATVTDVVDLSAEASVPTTGNLQLSTTVTTGDKLVVIFFAQTAGA